MYMSVYFPDNCNFWAVVNTFLSLEDSIWHAVHFFVCSIFLFYIFIIAYIKIAFHNSPFFLLQNQSVDTSYFPVVLDKQIFYF
jgi:hypothetical protein